MGDHSYTVTLIKKIREDIINKKKSEFDDYIRQCIKTLAVNELAERKDELLESCKKDGIEKVEDGNYRLNMPLQLFHPNFKKGKVSHRVCRDAYCKVFGISVSVFKRIKKSQLKIISIRFLNKIKTINLNIRGIFPCLRQFSQC